LKILISYRINGSRCNMVESSCTILSENGRKIQIIESGKQDGVPILVLHGAPGSRLLYHTWVEDALPQGLRLISYDRPGYGASTPHHGRNVASAASDVATIAKALGIDRLSVWGLSGGGPHALACAALLPDLVVSAASLSSLAPYNAEGLDWFAGMSEDNVIVFKTAIAGRNILEPMVEASAQHILSSDASSFAQALRSQLNPVEAALVKEDFADYVVSQFREGIAERRDGWIDDDLAFTNPWGFELGQIEVPVLLWHGKLDQSVPFSHEEWLSRHIPNVDVRLSPDDGHASIARWIVDVHTWLLAKMA
jgi:pimeloyl-ACP methyl ester carboxylesterase